METDKVHSPLQLAASYGGSGRELSQMDFIGRRQCSVFKRETMENEESIRVLDEGKGSGREWGRTWKDKGD